MDVTSYLLGKKASGGGGGGDLDWSQLGYDEMPQAIKDGYDYALEIKNNWDSSRKSMDYLYQNNKRLLFFPKVDTSDVTSMYRAFSQSCLLEIGEIDTSKVTNFESAFVQCLITKFPNISFKNATNMAQAFQLTSITEVPNIDTSNLQSLYYCFADCAKLITIAKLNFSKVTNIEIAFVRTYGLTNLGGFENLGQAYSTTASENYSKYTLSLATSTKLTHDSLMNVINNLYDIATSGVQTQTLQLGTTNLAKLTAEEIAIATDKGWTVS